MGFSSQGGSVVIRSQDVAGTFNADTLTDGIGILLRSGALGSNRDAIVSDPEIGGGRDVSQMYLGAVSYSGEYEFYVRVEAVKTLLRALFGVAPAASTTTGVTTQTFTPSDAASLPFLSVHEEIGAGLEAFDYNDAVVNTFHLECDANGLLIGRAGLIAKNQEAGVATGTATTIDTTPMCVGTNITLTYNSISLSPKSFSLDLTNNFEDSDYRLGSFFLGDLTPKRRELTGSMSIRESDSSLWRQATNGISTATTPGGLTTKQPLVVNMKTYETIAGGTPVTPYSLNFNIPNYVLKPYALSPSGDDVIDSGIDGQAIRPSLATPLCTVTTKGGAATIA